MINVTDTMIDKVKDFVLAGLDFSQPKFKAKADEFWQALHRTGTEIWLDSGDMDAVRENWTEEMSALTTNNTLLNKEIQKGIYDDFILKAADILGDLSLDEKVMEIAFILNARHGARLVDEFGCKVSVELHTDLSFDLEGIVNYGKRFHDIAPDNFIVKVPYTSTGLIGARKLGEMGVPVNFTLGFSARQNTLAMWLAQPHFVNVFLGRLNSFVADNELGDGKNIGEKTTIASQNIVRKIRPETGKNTQQIAASMRTEEQVGLLAGIDVFTMPTKVSKPAREKLEPNFSDKTSTDYDVSFYDGVDPVKTTVTKLWEVSEREYELGRSLNHDVPSSGEEVAQRAREMGCADMFPELSDRDSKTIAEDGKIAVYSHWKERILSGEIAVDTLQNMAGLASFEADQKALDKRVRDLIS